jgi:exonuclease III
MIVQPSFSQINVSSTSHSPSKSITQSKNKFNNQVLDNSPFRITTLNVRGINASSKIDLIIDLIKSNSIHIFGVSETNLRSRTAKLLLKNHKKEYYGVFSSDDKEWRGSGVGFIIKKGLDNYIQQTGVFKGHVIYMDLFIKTLKYRIIQVYLPDQDKERTKIEEIYAYIQKIIQEGKSKQREIIIMGDFNINARKYINIFINNHWRFKIFDFFES